MMRKVILVLMAVLLMVGFVGCGKDAETTQSSPSTEPSPSQEPEMTFEFTSSQGVNEMYQLTDTNQIMSYMIKTKNGKLIMLDGGYERNYKEIVALAKYLTGQAVPEIEAWFFSHSHGDHVNAFSELMLRQQGLVKVNKIYHHFTSEEYVMKEEDGNLKNFRQVQAAMKKCDPEGNKTVVVEQGDILNIDGVQIEVMLVPDEDANMIVSGVAINEASVIYRMTLDEQRVMFLGDAYQVAGKRLLDAWKDNMGAEIVQMAHHGSQGVQNAVYAAIAPKVCLWPTPQWLWDNDPGTGYNTGSWETITLHRYMEHTLGVEHHYVAKDGLQQLVFPLDLD